MFMMMMIMMLMSNIIQGGANNRIIGHCASNEWQAIQYSSVNICTRPIALQLLHPPYHFSFQSSRISHKFAPVKLNLTLV